MKKTPLISLYIYSTPKFKIKYEKVSLSFSVTRFNFHEEDGPAAFLWSFHEIGDTSYEK
jgi:hypothetical protein